jgi:rod shape-determining protein MreB
VIRPLQGGVIIDLEAARRFVAAIVRQAAAHPWQRARLLAVLCVPAGATALERQALLESADQAKVSTSR